MDYSAYLRQKKAAQLTFISRQKPMDAGLRTYIKQKAADSYYVSPNSNPAILHSTECCPTRTVLDSFEVTPVKPASGCSATGACAQLTDPYTTPYMVLPCCPIDYGLSNVNIGSAVGDCYCYQATPAQQSEAVARVVNRERGLCCESSPPPSNCASIDLDVVATYLRNYMTEFRNSNFWAYTMDGNDSRYIEDGGDDMFDGGNFTTPWLLSGTRYDLTSDSANDYPECIYYDTTTASVTDTDFNYVSLGWIYAPDTDEPQEDQSRHPLTVMGYRCSGPVGWQVGGEIGADGSGTAISGYVYSNGSVNGFNVYAGYRQVYDAGDPTICHLVILLGHPSWGSSFGPVTLIADDDDTDSSQFVMYSGAGSKNIFAIYTLLSKPDNDDATPIDDSELQTVIGNFTLRIKESLGL